MFITLVYLWLLNHSCIPDMKYIWSWSMILLMYFVFALPVIVEDFASKYISDSGL